MAGVSYRRLNGTFYYKIFSNDTRFCSRLLLAQLIAGSLESANSSILPAHNLFKDFGGEKNQDFMLIRLTIPVI